MLEIMRKLGKRSKPVPRWGRSRFGAMGEVLEAKMMALECSKTSML